ncbi:hypothetical protein GW17_00048439 [Ensete ventricosum]|nr:hypothetical protein GW17_00048439 [Ensete ventricosum]
MVNPSVQRLGSSIDVPSVQSLAASIANPAHVPPRYVRPEAKADPVASDGESELPVIDFSRLLHHRFSREESTKLHHACADWGFFQVSRSTDRNLPDDAMEKMKADIVEFFKLPLEEKKAFAQLPNSLEGYGQAFVVSDDQKLDWADMLYLITRPHQSRNIDLWPAQPLTFRFISTTSAVIYSAVQLRTYLKSVAATLLELIAKNLGIAPEEFSTIFQDQPQGVRINYYPPCPRADEVLGLSPHTDGSGLTLLLQVNDVEGLHIKKGGNWFPVKPLPGALIANIGDIIERLSIAAFHGPREDSMIGPLAEIVKGCESKYVSINYGEFIKAYFSVKLDGRRLMDSLKL